MSCPPVLINVKFDGVCHECKDVILAGTRAYYDGSTRKLYCIDCGEELKEEK